MMARPSMHHLQGTAPPRSSIWRSRLLLGAAVLCVFLAVEWHSVLSLIGHSLIDSEAPQSADLILVLGGDFWGPRVIQGAELGKLGYAPLVLISSPPYAGLPEGELAEDFLIKRGYPKEMFAIFAHRATSTIAEAIVLKGELARRRAKQVLLVTSAYHSRRAAIVFRLFCPGVHFISVPAPPSEYHPENWWRQKESRGIFFSEWTKILGTVTIAYPAYLVSRIEARFEKRS
jgi:uncharacterized SAM-binding protein YcdF (DUF218 family)